MSLHTIEAAVATTPREQEIPQIVGHATRTVVLPNNATLYTEGYTANALYVVREGTIASCRITNNYNRVILDIVRPPRGIVGLETSDQGTDDYQTTAVAVGETKVTEIGATHLKALLHCYPTFMGLLFQATTDAWRRAVMHIELLRRGTSRQRVAHALLEFSDENGEINVIQQVIADRAGLTRETVNIVIHQLKKSVTSGKRAQMRITDRNALRHIADEDYSIHGYKRTV